jgi:phosphoserine aminotransferase
MSKIFFTPGPAQLYPTVASHVVNALNENIGSISHRGKQFQVIYQEADEHIRALLGVPQDFKIFFTGSATEIWERILQNTVENHSTHFVNGSFSKKFYEFSVELGNTATKFEVPFGNGFDINAYEIPSETELICVTHNETSSGVMMPTADIHALRAKNPNAIIAVDAVSSVPYPQFDFKTIDSAFFSVQKGMGLPAGLGVWIVNDRCIDKANALKSKGKSIGTYHSLPSLWSNGSKFETPSTPNVFGIYLLAKVTGDMLKKGVDVIRKETDLKAAKLYDFVEKSSLLEVFVQNTAHRSPTVIVANTTGVASDLINALKPLDLILGAGYGNFKDKQVRIANFPAVSVENVERLLDELSKI